MSIFNLVASSSVHKPSNGNNVFIPQDNDAAFYLNRFKYQPSVARYFFRSLPIYKKHRPIFFSGDHADHHLDSGNIDSVIQKQKISKDDLSIIIFDFHTDMYQGENYPLINEKLTSANWVLDLVAKGYSDISIIGVVDFTLSSKELPGYEYYHFKDVVNFYVAHEVQILDYYPEHDHKNLPLHPLDSFEEKQLRKYSFISLDSDVSSDFTQYLNCKAFGYLPMDSFIPALEHIANDSIIIGKSFYGMKNILKFRDENIDFFLDH